MMAYVEEVVRKIDTRRARIINIIEDTVSAYSQKTACISDGHYRDEPIIKTASQLNNYTPDKIIKMRQISNQGGMSPQELFYRQGVFMADFEDDYYRPIEADKISYRYPTYQSMRDRELRMYFSWRTKVRRTGEISSDVPAFLLLYIYEILNLIGFGDSYSAFHEFVKIYDKYKDLSYIGSYLHSWYRDFVAYYKLDLSYLQKLPDMNIYESQKPLFEIESSDEAIFNSICMYSGYDIKRSPALRKSEKLYRDIICDAYRRIFIAKRTENKSFAEELFEPIIEEPLFIFSGAVFFHKENIKEYSYDYYLYKIICIENKWFIRRYDSRFTSNLMGNFLKYIDHTLRKEYRLSPPFKNEPKVPFEYKAYVLDAIIGYKQRQEELMRPQVTIDMSLLGDIRSTANVTMHKLLVDEDIFFDYEITCENQVCNDFHSDLLADDEIRLIRLLIANDNYNVFLKENNLLLSVIVDSINEKLFETFQDTVVVTDGNNAELIEDYIEDLKGLVY